jgi:hypothetical protein
VYLEILPGIAKFLDIRLLGAIGVVGVVTGEGRRESGCAVFTTSKSEGRILKMSEPDFAPTRGDLKLRVVSMVGKQIVSDVQDMVLNFGTHEEERRSAVKGDSSLLHHHTWPVEPVKLMVFYNPCKLFVMAST